MSGNQAEGKAALSLTESLILLLIEKEVVTAEDVAEVLEISIDCHRNAGSDHHDADQAAAHISAARLIERLLLGRNLNAAMPRS